jgi:hypothetical protein
MRPTKHLRQGNTIYISTLCWNAEERYFYGETHQCLVTNTLGKSCNVFLRYKSYAEAVPGLPLLEGAIAKNPRKDLQFASGFRSLHFTKNSALKFMKYHVDSMNQMVKMLMIKNFNSKLLVGQCFRTTV